MATFDPWKLPNPTDPALAQPGQFSNPDDPLDPFQQWMKSRQAVQTQTSNTDPLAQQPTVAQQNAQQNAQSPAPTVQAITSTTVPAWAKQTSGRSGASYSAWLAANPTFDPWSNLDNYAGAGAGNDPIFRFAFAKTNDVAHSMGYSDGSQIPLAQRQQIFMANVERARQQWTDLQQQQANGDKGAAAGMQGVTWDSSMASRIPSSGWGYQAGWGLSHPGQSYETQGPQAGGNNVSANNAQGGDPNNPNNPVANQQPVTPPVAVGSGTNQGTSSAPGGLGQFQTNDWMTALQAAKGDPGVAAHLLRLAQGQTAPITTRLGKFRDNLYGNSLAAYLSLAGQGGNPDLNNGIQDFYSHMTGNDLTNFLQQAGGKAAGADYTGMQDTDIEQALRAAIALMSLNTGAIGGARMQSGLNNLLYQQEGLGLQNNSNDTSNLGTLLRSTPFARQLQQYGGAQ